MATNDMDHTTNRAPPVIRSAVAIMILSTVALVLRLISKRLMPVSLKASDYTLIAGWLFACALAGTIFREFHLGVGRHEETLPPETIVEIFKVLFTGEILFCISITLIKISILLFYCSIFPVTRFILAAHIVGALALAWVIACVLAAIFTCNPISGFWDESKPSTCISTRAFFLGQGITNVLIDVLILSLPVRRVWKLQKLEWKVKAAISGMFLLGGFVCIASVIRCSQIVVMDPKDATWTYTNEHLWAIVETQSAVISACLPTLKPVVMYMYRLLHRTPSQSTPINQQASREGVSARKHDRYGSPASTQKHVRHLDDEDMEADVGLQMEEVKIAEWPLSVEEVKEEVKEGAKKEVREVKAEVGVGSTGKIVTAPTRRATIESGYFGKIEQ